MELDTFSSTITGGYPVEMFQVESSNTSISFTWSPPPLGSQFTTGYQLTCTPLIEGIPSLPPTRIGPEVVSASLTGLYSGVVYLCSIVTLTAEGLSEPRTAVSTTTEIGLLQHNHLDITCKMSL